MKNLTYSYLAAGYLPPYYLNTFYSAYNFGAGMDVPTRTALNNHQAISNFNAVNEAIKQWQNVVGVTFTKQANNTFSDFTLGLWNNGIQGSATTVRFADSVFGSSLPPNNQIGSIWLNTAGNFGAANLNPTVQNWGYWTVMHEFGHILGLNHSANNPVPQTVDLRLSIMDYPVFSNGIPSPNVKIPLTPGMTDIATLQNLRAADGQLVYGSSQTSNGNDSYVFTQVTVGTVTTGTVKLGTLGGLINIDPNKAVMTIYDSGGIDTINAAGVNTTMYINLDQQAFSAIGTNRNFDGPASDTNYNVGIARGAVIENAIGGTKADTLVGNAYNNVLIGGAGNDSLMGQGGSDNLSGDAGNDTLDGGPSNDTMSGGADNDRLIGSVGSDVYTGGTGADAFVFNFFGFNNITGIDTDRITDFNRVQGDKIDLSFIDANKNTPQHITNEAFNFYANGSFVEGVAGRLISQAGTNGGVAGAMVSADVDGNAVADFNIFLVGVVASTMLASDFIL